MLSEASQVRSLRNNSVIGSCSLVCLSHVTPSLRLPRVGLRQEYLLEAWSLCSCLAEVIILVNLGGVAAFLFRQVAPTNARLTPVHSLPFYLVIILRCIANRSPILSLQPSRFLPFECQTLTEFHPRGE
ncbi:hypothetical protein VNO77_34449 [Canavalia gladiata]|uniref:Uncharacterized protein n=1 Tax=Canavalia gladiata TaxID=3824 RepID=A0AAN9KEB2_CANGL